MGGGVRFVIDYVKSQAQRETRRRITGETEGNHRGLFVLGFFAATEIKTLFLKNFRHVS